MNQSIKDQVAEGKIRKQDEFLNITLNSLTHLFLVIDVNDYTIRKFNQAAGSGDLPPGATCYQLTHGSRTPCHGDNHICAIGEIKKTKKPVVVEHIHTDKDGNFRNIEVRGFPILNDTGDVVEIIEYFLDITERKQTEEELKEANSIINRSSSVAFTWKNMEGWPVEFVTKNVEKLFGYTAEEFLSGAVSYSECIHPDDLQRVGNEVETFGKEDGRTEFVHEPYRIVKKDSSVRVISDWTFIVRNDQGQITHYKGIVEDITERKRVEDELKEKNRLTHIILDSLPFPAMLIGKDKVVMAANKVAKNVGAQVGGFCWRDFGQSDYISEKDKDYINNHKCVPEGGTHCTFCLADKTFETNELQNSSEINAFGRIWDAYWIPVDDEIFLHFAIDVTERKQAEIALKAEKDRAQNYLDIAGAMFSVVDADETISLINNRGNEILGYNKGELIGKNWFDTLVPERSRKEVRGVFNKLMAGDIKPVEFNKNFLVTKGGEERLIAFHNTVTRDSEGKIIGALLSAEDITEQKQMERKLQKRTHDLGERVKELGCLFSISKLMQNPNCSYKDVLQGVIEIIPPSLQYPEITCARLTIENEKIKTANFCITAWQMTSKIIVSKKEIGLLEIGYLEERPASNEGPFMKEERALIEAITGILGRYIEHKRAEDALLQTNEKLTIEQEALKEKNITLKEVLSQIEKEKKQIAFQTQSNIDRVVMPVLNKLEEKMRSDDKTYTTLLRNSLNEITHPFINNMEIRFSKLTPREIEVCNMIRSGLSSKEIASTLNTSVGTVFNQRKTIRKKLGIANDRVNLSSFLHTS